MGEGGEGVMNRGTLDQTNLGWDRPVEKILRVFFGSKLRKMDSLEGSGRKEKGNSGVDKGRSNHAGEVGSSK